MSTHHFLTCTIRLSQKELWTLVANSFGPWSLQPKHYLECGGNADHEETKFLH